VRRRGARLPFLSPVSIQTQSLALRKRKPQETQALALASCQSWLPLLRPSIPIGWRLHKFSRNKCKRRALTPKRVRTETLVTCETLVTAEIITCQNADTVPHLSPNKQCHSAEGSYGLGYTNSSTLFDSERLGCWS